MEALLFCASGVMIILVFLLIRHYIASLVDRRISQYQNDLMERHMEEVEHMYRLTRGWRHDLKSHLQTMKAYIYLKEYDKLDHFLNELDTDLETLDHVVKTGNVAMDTVLNSKLSLARSQNIHVEAKAIIPGELRISSVDLSVIVGNLMDNAMEACMKMELPV